MSRSGAEVVVANDLTKIKEEHHPATICWKDEEGISMKTVDGKPEIAQALCELLEQFMNRRKEDRAE